MAAAKQTPPPAPEETPAATVAPQQYAAGTGWQVGDTAPTDAFRALDDHGNPTGPVSEAHPGGYARLIVAAGATITDGVRRELDAADAEGDEG